MSHKQTKSISSKLAKFSPGEILEKNINRTSLNAFCFLFSEMLQYSQARVNGIQDLERKLNEFGQRLGQRALELLMFRDKNTNGRRDPLQNIVKVLSWISTVVWKWLVGKEADSIERSAESDDEFPKELSQLNCSAFVAGIIEGILNDSEFPCKVTAHSVPMDGFPLRTTFLIKFDRSVIEREIRVSS